jgi:hypothetical protein
MTDKTHAVCSVCSGKGGWKKEVRHWSDNNWLTCLYCDGYGFHEKQRETEEPSGSNKVAMHGGYRVLMSEILENHGKVISVRALDEDLHEIRFVPNNRRFWIGLIKTILKIGSFHPTLKVEALQNFYYADKNKYHYYWIVRVYSEGAKDLSDFIDALKAYCSSATDRDESYYYYEEEE